ncbi:hypothetical protein HYALB_00001314 [Hymenoscyphus albidus]|uniref:Uncharacterized protein n=1 Tax=Hymenoscyphus albidus TaxID=595503 RepID=A0A9N9LIC6_9HELO|nr:hypothetical protein HYALB_00001314 [Hymenoscyphus albidus]
MAGAANKSQEDSSHYYDQYLPQLLENTFGSTWLAPSSSNALPASSLTSNVLEILSLVNLTSSHIAFSKHNIIDITQSHHHSFLDITIDSYQHSIHHQCMLTSKEAYNYEMKRLTHSPLGTMEGGSPGGTLSPSASQPPPVTISPLTTPSPLSKLSSRQRSPHSHEYVYCHEKTCPLQQEIHCMCLKECTAGTNSQNSSRSSSSMDHLPPRQHALAITYEKFQTETPYLVKDSHVPPPDPVSDEDLPPDSSNTKDTKNGAIYWSRKILVTLKDKVMPALSGTAFVPYLPAKDRGKGVDRTRTSSTVAVYENSFANTLVDEPYHRKQKQEWIEDVDAHLKKRKFSFNLPTLDGVAFRDIDDFGNVKQSAESAKTGAPAISVGGLVDHEPIDTRFIEDLDRNEEPQDYMAERAADKAKREEMMNKLPTVHEHHEETPVGLTEENIPPPARLESNTASPCIPGPSRMPSLRLPSSRLSFGSDHPSEEPLTVPNPNPIASQGNSLERYHSKAAEPPRGANKTRRDAITGDLVDINDIIKPDDEKSEQEDVGIKACDQPRRVSEWLRNVPMPQTWKKKRQGSTRSHATYVGPDSLPDTPTNESKCSQSSTKTSMNSIRQALKEWKPFQPRKSQDKPDSSSDESPIRGRPRQRVDRSANVQVM